MANTGKKIYNTLKQVYTDDMTPTGLTKPNQFGQADYIVPSDDLTACPISYSTDCPTECYATHITGTGVLYEYAVSYEVLKNPNIVSIRTVLEGTSGIEGTNTVAKSTIVGNYITGMLSYGSLGSHSISVDYLNSDSNVISTCSDLKFVNVDS